MPIPEEQIGPDTIFKSVSITIKFTNSETFRQKKAINIGSIYNILLSILCDDIQSQIWRVSFVAFWLTALYGPTESRKTNVLVTQGLQITPFFSDVHTSLYQHYDSWNSATEDDITNVLDNLGGWIDSSYSSSFQDSSN